MILYLIALLIALLGTAYFVIPDLLSNTYFIIICFIILLLSFVKIFANSK